MSYPSPGMLLYSMAFELSPITMVGGISQGMFGGLMPILSVLQAPAFQGLLGGGQFAASFYPLPGSSLIDNQIGNYPFANMKVAANAIIAQPLSCSILMQFPISPNMGAAGKLALMTSLQRTLDLHCTLGGTFTVATPSFFYTDCILINLSDVSGGETQQVQVRWKFDFIKPLVSLSEAAQKQNTQMNMLSSGVQTNGMSSGPALTVGQPATFGAPATSSLAQNTAAAGVVGS